jgi:hypothetical protein
MIAHKTADSLVVFIYSKDQALYPFTIEANYELVAISKDDRFIIYLLYAYVWLRLGIIASLSRHN